MVIVPAIPSARFMRTTSWGQFAIKSSHELCCAGYPRRGDTPTITYRRWRFTPLAFWSNDSLSVAIHKTIKFAVALVTHHHQAVEFHSKRIRVCRGTRTFVIGSCSTSVMATIMRNVNWTINSNFGTFIPDVPEVVDSHPFASSSGGECEKQRHPEEVPFDMNRSHQRGDDKVKAFYYANEKRWIIKSVALISSPSPSDQRDPQRRWRGTTQQGKIDLLQCQITLQLHNIRSP